MRPQVPVTRIDLSGYGESLFSNWLNPTDESVAVSQARFDVLIGRTSYEIIQVRSVLYPYAVRVMFSWLTEKGVLAMNPAREVKTERFSRTEGKAGIRRW